MNNDTGAETMGLYQSGLSEKEFRCLSGYIHDSCGIKICDSKRSMLEIRLRKRLRDLSISSFADYCRYVFHSDRGENEIPHMIDAVTTNKTDFFRESAHFRYLTENVLPDLLENTGAGLRRPLHVWSAGCSTGEEPYTLAMVLSEFEGRSGRFIFDILATDICTKVLSKAEHAVYDEERVSVIPESLKRKYLLRSRDRCRKEVRISPVIREKVRYKRLNFMDSDFGLKDRMDVIFCRNVIIYFDRNTQEKLLRHFCMNMAGSGYLFVGHSETLHGLDLPLVQVAPTVYKRTA